VRLKDRACDDCNAPLRPDRNGPSTSSSPLVSGTSWARCLRFPHQPSDCVPTRDGDHAHPNHGHAAMFGVFGIWRSAWCSFCLRPSAATAPGSGRNPTSRPVSGASTFGLGLMIVLDLFRPAHHSGMCCRTATGMPPSHLIMKGLYTPWNGCAWVAIWCSCCWEPFRWPSRSGNSSWIIVQRS